MDLKRATPPPASIPSSIAARVAFRASSVFLCFAFCSTSVAAPTFITATPPANLANLSCNFSLSNSDSVVFNSFLTWEILASISSFFPLPSMMVVFSFVETTFRAWPKFFNSTFSSFNPNSSEINWAPVTTATSCNISFLLSPNPGAFTAKALKIPLNLLTTRVAKASPSTSSAIMTRSFFPVWAIFSIAGKISVRAEIFLSVTKI